MKIPYVRRVNPIARAVAMARRRQQIVPPKKGKGSYDRNKNRKIIPNKGQEEE